jgi:uncharacterized membrane protein
MSVRESLRAVRAARPLAGVSLGAGALHDYALVAAATIVLAALLILGDRGWPLAPLRVALGALFVLYLPGHALLAAILPAPRALGRLERLGLSFGLSLAVVSLLAFTLDRLPWGIGTWQIFVAEALVIGVAMGAAGRRRIPFGLTGAVRTDVRARLGVWWCGLPPPDRRTFRLIGVAVACALLAATQILVVASPRERFTAFYLIGAEGRAEAFPYRVTTGEELAVTLGVTNVEGRLDTYRIEAWAVDPWRAGRRERVAELAPVTIPPGATLERPVRWRMPWAGGDQQVELLLFHGESPEPYRRLRLWMDVAPPR